MAINNFALRFCFVVKDECWGLPGSDTQLCSLRWCWCLPIVMTVSKSLLLSLIRSVSFILRDLVCGDWSTRSVFLLGLFRKKREAVIVIYRMAVNSSKFSVAVALKR